MHINAWNSYRECSNIYQYICISGVLKRNEKLLYDTINKHRGSRVDLEQSKADICLHSTLGHKDTSKLQFDLL